MKPSIPSRRIARSLGRFLRLVPEDGEAPRIEEHPGAGQEGRARLRRAPSRRIARGVGVVSRLRTAAGAFAIAAVLAAWASGAPPAVGSFYVPEQETEPSDPLVKDQYIHAGPASSLSLTPGTNQDEFDVTHYRLELAFTPANEIVSGTVTITGTSLVPLLAQVDLDFRDNDNMTVTDVRSGSTSVGFSRGGNVLRVSLDRPYAVQESWQIAVTYSGHPVGSGSSLGSFNWTVRGSSKVIWSLSEPEGARIWWPCKDRPDDKVTAEMVFTVPEAYTATSNGLLTGVTHDTVNHTKTYTWVENYPITSYLISIAAYPYVTFSDTYVPIGGGAMPVDYYVYPEDLTKAQVSFAPTVAMIEFFAETFGEYPFVDEKYGMTEFEFGGAMEHQANTSYGRGLITGNNANDRIVAHELAHQWWGDAVSPRLWADIWLNEGFASYSEALWDEHVNGTASYRQFMQQKFYRATWNGTVYNPPSLFGYTVYYKGAWIQHMLRHVVGDGAFFLALRSWYENHKYGVGDTANYQAEVEAASGGSTLGWFFAQWVYAPGMPSYNWSWSAAQTGSGHDLYLRVDQTQVNAPIFRMPIDIDVTTASGTTRYVIQDLLASHDFRIPLAEAPLGVALDPEEWILKTRTQVAMADQDGDGVPDRNDDCPSAVNPDQDDFDSDQIGDECDPDDDNDLILDGADCGPRDASAGRPLEVTGVVVTATQVSWAVTPGAERYDVSKGLLTASRAGDYGACLADSVPGTLITDPQSPAPGNGFVYLVRGIDDHCGGAGTWGTDSTGSERVNGHALACP